MSTNRYDGKCHVHSALDPADYFGERPMSVFADSPEEAYQVACRQKPPAGEKRTPIPGSFQQFQSSSSTTRLVNRANA